MPAAPIFAAIGGITSGIGAIGQISASRAQGKALGELAEQATAAAEPSIEELLSIKKAIEVEGRTLARSETLLEATTPGLVEAGRELHRLLQGEEASSLGPVRRQRQEQRRSLVNNLRQRGIVEGSTAYTQAINDFDAETSDVLNRAQQGQIDRFLQSSLSTSSQAFTAQGQAVGLGAQLLGRIADRRVAAAGGGAQRRFLEAKGSAAGFKGLSKLGQTFGAFGEEIFGTDPTFRELGDIFKGSSTQEINLGEVTIGASPFIGPEFDPLSPGQDVRVERAPATVGNIFEQS